MASAPRPVPYAAQLSIRIFGVDQRETGEQTAVWEESGQKGFTSRIQELEVGERLQKQ